MRIVIVMLFLTNVCYAANDRKTVDMNSMESSLQTIEKTLNTFRPFVIAVNDANSKTTLNKCEQYAETMIQIMQYSKDNTLPDNIYKRCQCITSTFSRLWTTRLLPRLRDWKEKQRVETLSNRLGCFQRKS